MSSAQNDPMYVVVKADGRLKAERRKVRVWLTRKGAEDNANEVGDAVHGLHIWSDPVFIRRKVL